MITRHGPALSFWLDYLDSRGGLWERSDDTVLAVLPEQLAATHDLPESALITDDPDISREDGVLFLDAGHPEIGRAAESVIGTGDVGALTLPHRSQPPPSTQDLQAMIRELIAVDHGRIDATGAPIRTHRPTVRLAVLVTHTVSEDQFTEVAECLVDVASRIAWPEESATRLRHAVATTEIAPSRNIRTGPLVPALAAAHEVLNATAAARGRILAADADAERTAELTRACEYYAAALAAIDKRRNGADQQRAALLDARAEATTAERDRRVAEINEKYRHQHTLRPYRLHLIDVPVWRLDTDVRRGDRRWPVTFDYLPLVGALAPTRCPTCDASAPLVATKTHLGCTACVPAKAEAPPPKPPTRPTNPPSTAQQKEDRPPTAPERQKREPVRPPTSKTTAARVAGPVLPRKADEKKVVDFWHLVAAEERRKLARLIAADSPLAALTRLYGACGPLYGVGVPVGHTPVQFTCGNYDQPVAGHRGATGGTLSTHHGQYRYLLLWSRDRLLEELLPYSMPWLPGMASRYLGGPTIQVPPTHVALDPVAKLLFTTSRNGLTFTARALAAWWRLPDPDDLVTRFPPRVLAASVDRAVRYWSRAGQATYPEAAKAFGADQADIRKATPVLQKHLQLNETTNW
ncbi:MAG: hypothetical protein GEV28_06140 [Actinophytocola sp.]|uniref:hypothetical protein n=1 Tax=Actinophytocola sp. TaxID=1872138 RepID=UPI00132C9D54|nr:hypothetical protein [Actinophytocola sp.]MPZ79989.1 hypothetical protein [Actinophytocola sp.]